MAICVYAWQDGDSDGEREEMKERIKKKLKQDGKKKKKGEEELPVESGGKDKNTL